MDGEFVSGRHCITVKWLARYTNTHTHTRTYTHTHTHTHMLGEFVGGCDIMMEMHESGDLKKMLTDAGATVA